MAGRAARVAGGRRGLGQASRVRRALSGQREGGERAEEKTLSGKLQLTQNDWEDGKFIR